MIEQRDVKKFVDAWKARGSEKSEAQLFWIAFLRLFNIVEPERFIKFEVPIDVDDHKCFIDAWIPTTKVLIEQKGRGIDLDKPSRQSDGRFLTPFEQALRYAYALPFSQRPRWIVVCNFDELRVFDMDRYHKESSYAPNVISIERLPVEFARLNFIVDPNDENVDPSVKISKQAGELVGLIYRSFEGAPPTLPPTECGAQPVTRFPPRADSALWAGLINKLCVRLVFCLYAEDSFIFERNQFTDYLKHSQDIGAALVELFQVLNTPKDRRDPNLRAELAAFPYVNGDLFAGADPIPSFNRAAKFYLMSSAKDFSWYGISPTIFGALFESTLNPVTRRAGGMHYTSIENIHKVIDPLFLDDLHNEFMSVKRKRKNKCRELERFQVKIASLKFFDPACGSGNFLTETFLSIRRLENEVIRELYGLGAHCQILVSIENFYGIEVNDFAVAVARTALWIAENQMLQETEMIIHEDINFLPLTSAAHIVEGNALTVDWSSVVTDGVDYIIGNPPFVGASMMSAKQKAEAVAIFGKGKLVNSLDYVGAWYYKAAALTVGTQTRAAFVSTNSICQGEQVAPLWQKLFLDRGIHIDFARRTFKWISESDDPAAVNCVIVGFSHAPSDRPRIIFDGDKKLIATNINPYLVDAPDVFIWSRAKPICADAPRMSLGNKPTDDGNLILSPEERDKLLRDDPTVECCIRPYIAAKDFLNGGASRYCLWLKDIDPKIYRGNREIMRRLDAVRRFRAESTSKPTRDMASTPSLFFFISQPTTDYIIVPSTSSERRKYIPIGFLPPTIIASNASTIVPSATLFEFGVLSSSVHMAWVRTVCGRLKSDYRYSTSVVYNNYVWCGWSARIEETARGILEARALYPAWTLAALYDEEKMPSELRAAHLENDRAVLNAYGFEESLSEDRIVAGLMDMYQRLAQ